MICFTAGLIKSRKFAKRKNIGYIYIFGGMTTIPEMDKGFERSIKMQNLKKN